MSNANPTYHEDGTVTFWSVYEQRWINRAHNVPDRELAAMPADEREQVKAYLALIPSYVRANWEYPSGADPMTVVDVEPLSVIDETADYADVASAGDVLIADEDGGQAEIIRIENGQVRQIWTNCY